ncbi:hypothetical protein SESBI_43848 [Sesbania bispinosa]|nr:hypothetical protein SESBI_43848 [Sesbania bispinosa]
MANMSPTSREEEDLRDRSTEKVKFDDAKEIPMEELALPDQSPSDSPIGKLSYKEMVLTSEGFEGNPEDMVKAVTEDLFPKLEDSDEENSNVCPEYPAVQNSEHPQEPTNSVSPPQDSFQNSTNLPEGVNVESTPKDSISSKDLSNPSQASCFGLWMLAKKPQRRAPKPGFNVSTKDGGNMVSKPMGSRFDALHLDSEDNVEPTGNYPSSNLEQPPTAITVQNNQPQQQHIVKIRDPKGGKNTQQHRSNKFKQAATTTFFRLELKPFLPEPKNKRTLIMSLLSNLSRDGALLRNCKFINQFTQILQLIRRPLLQVLNLNP